MRACSGRPRKHEASCKHLCTIYGAQHRQDGRSSPIVFVVRQYSVIHHGTVVSCMGGHFFVFFLRFRVPIIVTFSADLCRVAQFDSWGLGVAAVGCRGTFKSYDIIGSLQACYGPFRSRQTRNIAVVSSVECLLGPHNTTILRQSSCE